MKRFVFDFGHRREMIWAANLREACTRLDLIMEGFGLCIDDLVSVKEFHRTAHLQAMRA